MVIRTALLILIIAAAFQACKTEEAEVTGEPIARAFDNYLYADALSAAMPDGYSPEDSAAFAQLFINNWLRDQALLNKAEYNLTDAQKDVQKQLDELRLTLLIYSYENQFLAQNLDTIVNESEIKEYYKNNQEEFILKDYIVKVIYAKVEKSTRDKQKLIKWFDSGKEADMQNFLVYCEEKATNFYFDEQSWLRFDDLLKEIPIETYNKEAFIKKGRIHFEDDYYLYFLNFLDNRLKDDISPLSLERDNIKAIILNQRKDELVNKMRQDIVNDAMNNQQLEIYER